MKINIRALRPEDYAAVHAVWEAAGLSIRPQGRDTEAAVREQLRHFPDTYLVAEHEGRIVGMVFGTHDVRKGWINRLAVHPDCRRRGVARRLIEACERAFDARGIAIFAALIEGGNEESEEFFRQAGYEEFGPIAYYRKRRHTDV
ncbi:MAG: GNAT family N-acetyltransferase [Phycisphaerae bacterium]|nr:GNAT family N-acetyltransferase [Phycisphaerae bacterium]